MKKILIPFFILLLSCSNPDVIVQFVIRNATEKDIIIEHNQTDNKKNIYTISPSNSKLIYAKSISNENLEDEEFRRFISKINILPITNTNGLNVAKDSLSDLSKWIKNVSYDMGDMYILNTKIITNDMFE
jgi:hypothetical protein